MLRVAICDDDKYTCSFIESLILDYMQSNYFKVEIDVFYEGLELIDFISNQHSFDLVFLDIELDDITGIEIGNTIRQKFNDHITKIVFITSKNGYEYQLFNVQPLNFLKKPIDKSKLEEVIDLTIKLLELDNKMFEYNKNFEIIRVEIKDILYFEKVGKKVKIVTSSNVDYYNGTLESTRKRLPSIFIKSHGSFLININKVKRLSKDYIIMTNDSNVPVSQKNFKELKNLILNVERSK